MNGYIIRKQREQVIVNGRGIEVQRMEMIACQPPNGRPNYLPGFKGHLINQPPTPQMAGLPEQSQWPRKVSPKVIQRVRPLRQVVSNRAGQLYEQIDDKIRPLHKVVVDDQGHFFEVITEKPKARRAQTSNAALAELEDQQQFEPTDVEEPIKRAHIKRREEKPIQQFRAPYEKIFAEPGCFIQVAIGAFKKELLPCFLNPGDLNPSEKIDCYLQVYHVRAPINPSQIAKKEVGNPCYAWMFKPLTKEKAKRLGVPELYIQTQDGSNPDDSETGRQMQRFYRLMPAYDPTGEMVHEDKRESSKNEKGVKEFSNRFKKLFGGRKNGQLDSQGEDHD